MRCVSYLRVSTNKQERSGLGIEAQRAAVDVYAAGGRLIAEFVEQGSGADRDRPQLAKALALCRMHRAELVVARLDRLTRDVEYGARLLKGDVRIRALDYPEAENLMLHIVLAMAQKERELISQRTKAALQAARARGTKLGGDRGYRITAEATAKGTAALRDMADRHAAQVRDTIAELQASGVTGVRAIARALNDRDIPTARGCQWQPVTVSRLLARLG